jgi:hypothetical protein
MHILTGQYNYSSQYFVEFNVDNKKHIIHSTDKLDRTKFKQIDMITSFLTLHVEKELSINLDFSISKHIKQLQRLLHINEDYQLYRSVWKELLKDEGWERR